MLYILAFPNLCSAETLPESREVEGENTVLQL